MTGRTQAKMQILPPERHGDAEDVHITDEPLNDLEQDEQSWADQVTAEFNASPEETRWVIKAYRAAMTGQPRDAFLFDLTREEIDGAATRLRDRYGSGTYVIRIYANGKLRKRFTFQIEAPRDAIETRNGGDSVSAIVRAMTESNNVVISRLESLITPPNPNAHMESMRVMSEVVRNLSPQHPPAAADNSWVGPVVTTLGTVLTGLFAMIADSRAGNGSAETNLMDLGKTALENLGAILPALAGMRGGAMPPMLAGPPQPVPPRVTTAPPHNAQPAPQQPPRPQRDSQPAAMSAPEANNPFWAQFKPQLLFLSQRAAADNDPEVYAALLYDTLPHEILMQLTEDINGLLDTFAQVEPATLPYRAWFLDMVTILREGLTAPPDTGAHVPSGHPGNAGPASGPDPRGVEANAAMGEAG